MIITSSKISIMQRRVPNDYSEAIAGTAAYLLCSARSFNHCSRSICGFNHSLSDTRSTIWGLLALLGVRPPLTTTRRQEI
jgi:hypothetical protein